MKTLAKVGLGCASVAALASIGVALVAPTAVREARRVAAPIGRMRSSQERLDAMAKKAGWKRPAPDALSPGQLDRFFAIRQRVDAARRTADLDQLPRRGLLPLDREPGRLLLAELLDLLVELGVRDWGDFPREGEAPSGGERDVGTDLDVQLELDRAALFELDVPDRGIGDRLQGLRLAGLVPALADHFLEHGLADRFMEALADDGDRGMARAEAGQPHPASHLLHGTILGQPDPFDGHGDLE